MNLPVCKLCDMPMSLHTPGCGNYEPCEPHYDPDARSAWLGMKHGWTDAPVPNNLKDVLMEEETSMFDPEAPLTEDTYVRIQPFDGNHFMLRLQHADVCEITISWKCHEIKTSGPHYRCFREIPDMKPHTLGERVFYEILVDGALMGRRLDD